MIFGVLGLVAVGVLFRTWTSGTENGIRVLVQPREYRELEALLLELRRTWQPSARCRLLEKVRQGTQRWRSPLLWLLSQGQHQLLPEALELVEKLEFVEGRSHVMVLTREGHASSGVRPGATGCQRNGSCQTV